MKSFDEKKVLLTRSMDENLELDRMLANVGFQVECLPLIEILPNVSHVRLKALEAMMPDFDGFIFVSVNAAIYGMNLLQQYESVLKKNSRIITVGPRTAKELNTKFSAVLCPESGVGAHSLLATDEMLDVKGLKFLILRGRNGNPWLGKELQNRQAQVEYHDCYARRRPKHLEKELAVLFSDEMFDICFLHSAHAAVNLMESSGRLGQKISNTIGIVGSNAIKDVLIDYGWKGDIVVAHTPANTDMLKCLMASDLIR